MGIFTSIAGVIRVVYTVQTITLSYDETWGGYDLLLWTALENDLGIICASAPAMKPYINILEPYFRKFLSVLPRSTTKQLPQHLPTTNNYQHRGSAILTPPFQGNGQLGNESYVTSAGRANDTDHVTDGVLVEHEFSLLSTPKNNSCENADVKANIDILR